MVPAAGVDDSRGTEAAQGSAAPFEASPMGWQRSRVRRTNRETRGRVWSGPAAAFVDHVAHRTGHPAAWVRAWVRTNPANQLPQIASFWRVFQWNILPVVNNGGTSSKSMTYTCRWHKDIVVLMEVDFISCSNKLVGAKTGAGLSPFGQSRSSTDPDDASRPGALPTPVGFFTFYPAHHPYFPANLGILCFSPLNPPQFLFP